MNIRIVNHYIGSLEITHFSASLVSPRAGILSEVYGGVPQVVSSVTFHVYSISHFDKCLELLFKGLVFECFAHFGSLSSLDHTRINISNERQEFKIIQSFGLKSLKQLGSCIFILELFFNEIV
jgi:hypothetical protein